MTANIDEKLQSETSNLPPSVERLGREIAEIARRREDRSAVDSVSVQCDVIVTSSQAVETIKIPGCRLPVEEEAATDGVVAQ